MLSARPRIQAYLSIGLFVVVLVGVSASFYFSAAPEVDYQPRVDVADADTLSKTQNAAMKGNPQAQYDLGLTYWHADNYKEALPLIRSAANAGHADAQYLMGTAYLEGRGIVQNFRGALEYFSKAADQGHLEAEYRVGIFKRDGLAGSRDREAAYVWLNIAAAQGHVDALASRERLTLAMTGEEIMRAQEASAQMHEKLSAKSSQQPKPTTAAQTVAH